MRKTVVEATPETVRAVDEALTVRKLLIEEEALLTIRAPITDRAVVEALVMVPPVVLKVVAVKSTVRRLLIDDEALFTIKLPVTDRAVDEALVISARPLVYKLVEVELVVVPLVVDSRRMVEEAVTMMPPPLFGSTEVVSDEVANLELLVSVTQV